MAEAEQELTSETPEADVQMTIWEHIAELRSRLVRAALALGAGFGVCWVVRERLLAYLTEPYKDAWREKFPDVPVELQTLAPADVFLAYMQLALVGGIILATPVIFYQLWAFISPGLYAREKRYIIPFVTFSTLLFVSGVAFGYYVAFPFSFEYFFSLLGPLDGNSGVIVTSRPTMEFYLDFATRLLLAFGFVFELPLFIAFLALAGIVTPRQLLRFSRWAIVLAFVVGAFVTPPDVASQAAVAGALILLYFISVGLAYVVAPRRRDDEPAA